MTKVAIGVDQLSRPQPGGTATYIRGLLRGLAEIAPELEVVGVGPHGTPAVEHLHTLRRVPVPITALPLVWSRVAWGFRGADVWHGTSLTGPFARSHTTARRTHALQDLLWRDVPEMFTPRGVAFHERQYEALCRHEHIDIVTSSPTLAQRVRDSGVDGRRVHTFTLGVDASSQPDGDGARALLRRHGITGEFLLTVGTVEPRKNLSRLNTAVRTIASLPPVVVVGAAGWGEVETDALAVVGPQPEGIVQALRRMARAHVFVPVAEGWGLPAVEALAAGRPLLVSSTVPSAVGRADALVVNPLDVDALIDGLVRVLEAEQSDEAASRRRASVASLTWASCARDHVAVWR